MNRFQIECLRLFGPASLCAAGMLPADEPTCWQASLEPAVEALALVPARTRVMGLQVMAPSDWAPLGEVWRWVQAECGWPAPAIVVAGPAMQLWFALAEPVPVADAHAWLCALVRRVLVGLPSHRLAIWPPLAKAGPQAEGEQHRGLAVLEPPQVPHALDPDGERWTAFVASDLAPLFADTPWLDVAPSLEGQAQLLCTLRPVSAVAWTRAQSITLPPPASTPSGIEAEAKMDPVVDEGAGLGELSSGIAAEVHQDPAAFLHAAMNNPRVPWMARIEAAKVLLSLRRPGATHGDVN
ncbi:MAG: hypothetical protein RL722_1709 [Pseudomonadota bacterium]|jgi:hypothetical protein